MYVKIKELPQTIQSCLQSIGYHRVDITVKIDETFTFLDYGGTGQRDFVIVGNIATGEYKKFTGSWGGPNPWTRGNLVDSNESPVNILPEMFVVKGSEGYHMFAFLIVSPSCVNQTLLNAPAESLSEDEKNALYCFKCIKGGNYRKEELRKLHVTNESIEKLIATGKLKKDGRGISITTEGKNSLAENFYPRYTFA